VTRTVALDVTYLGEWNTPFWVGDESKRELSRIGFEATTRIDRRDFTVSWQDELPGGGVVVSNQIDLALDVEGLPPRRARAYRRDRPLPGLTTPPTGPQRMREG
jgi:hypothetical protein